jgi:hypothetical protein
MTMRMISATDNAVFATDNPVFPSVLFDRVGPFAVTVDSSVVVCGLSTTHAVASLFIIKPF